MPTVSPRISAVIAAALVLIASARIVSTYLVLSHTIDEPAHLGAGMQWLEAHRYDFEDQHPPLACVACEVGCGAAGNLPAIYPIPGGPCPPPGWTAVSITVWKLHPIYPWIGKIPPAARIGRSLLLYYVP